MAGDCSGATQFMIITELDLTDRWNGDSNAIEKHRFYGY